MPDLFDYLTWRGDIALPQVPFCAVDNLILSTLTYVRFPNVPASPGDSILLKDAVEGFFLLPEGRRERVRCKQDLALLRVLAQSPRFRDLPLTYCEDRFEPEHEMQFAAVTVLLDEHTAFLAFRGTDSTLVGLMRPQNIQAALRTFKNTDAETRRVLAQSIERLIRTTADTLRAEVERTGDIQA